MAAMHGLLLLLLVLTAVQVAEAACANSCSGHGQCGSSNQCICDSNWALAPDCSLRKCPTGVAWTDKAKTANVAHALAECSNRGVCDYSKGECACFNGYTGAACQRLKCPSDCSGHGLCYSSATLSLQYGPDSLPSVAGDGIGPVYSNWEKDSVSSCLCDMGYTGPDCSQLMCAKNDDPLTLGQGYRTIRIQVGADSSTSLPLAGSVRIHFLGDVAVFDAVAVADTAHEQACAKAFQAMRTVLTASCSIASVDPVTAAATYTVSFKEWTHLGGENNLLYHSGNPALTSFTCDLTQVTSLNSPTCAISDVTATNVIEHIYCSNRGLCDFSTGQCICYADFKGMDCNQPSNVPDSIDENDGFIVNPMGLTYTGTVLNLKTAKGSQADFYFMKIGSSTQQILTMNGMGDTKLLTGNLEISTGSLTVTTTDQESTAADIANTHTWFTGTALKVRTTRASDPDFKLFEAITGADPIVRIRGDGLTTIYTGGLYVKTGGGTISHSSNAPSLTVDNSNSGFSSSLLKLTTSRASLYPAPDFSLIEATANGAQAFTVKASGRTTIANGGLIVDGSGGGQILNSDPSSTSSALLVKATDGSFAGNAVVIQTNSNAAHNMLKITTGASSTVLTTISKTGLMTITQGGLFIGTGGATVDSGGLYITAGGETIETGGLRIKKGGETILQGGLDVVDGGGKIASLSMLTDILTIEASSSSFSNDARVLHIDSKSTVDPSLSMHYLIEATIGASSTSVFKVDATGLATFAGQGSGGASISDTGTTANTLTVTNSATGFIKALLALKSTSPSTFKVIDATVGATSIFNVMSSGLTTIAGQGSGGVIISDSNTGTISTLSVTNTAAVTSGFTGAIVAVDTTTLEDTGSYSLIDARVKTVSKFTVAASGKTTIGGGGLSVSGGLTVVDTGVTVTAGNVLISSTTPSTAVNTGALVVKGGGSIALDLYVGDSLSVGTGGLDVADGGGTIASVSTATDTLIVKNTAASGATFPHAILAVDTTALSTGSFSLIDARVVGSSKFTVAASGKTTIAGGGLSVSGGLTVVDTGVTVSAGNVLISSTTPSTAVDTGALVVKGGGSIALDLYVGDSLSVGTGGLDVADGGGTIASVSTATDTLIVKNTAASGATFPHAILAVDTTALSTGSFSLIDARVVGSSKFTVAASGKTTIAGGGLSVSGGLTVVDTGVTVSAGNVLISSTTPSTAVNTGALVVKGGGSIALDLYVGDSLSVGTGGLDVADGGGTIASVSTATDTLIVKNTAASGATFPHAILAVDTTALSTGSFSLIDARVVGSSKFTVAASGKTTIAGGGLSVSGGLTVVDTGVTVSAGNVLISSTTPSTAVDTGALVVKGGGSIALDLYVGDSLSVGTGGLDVADGGGTIASVSTATDTLIVKNTAASGATFPHAILAVDTTALSTGSFSLIDARVVGSSKFTVAASGKTTIAGGGLSVSGGLTVVDTGVTVSAGNVLISSTTPSTAVNTGALVVKGGGSIALDLYVGDSLSVGTGGLDVADGGGTIASVSTATDTLIVKNTAASGATFPHAILAVDTTALSTGSFSLIDARVVGSSKFTVAASGKTTIAGGGLDILATGTPVFTVATTGATTIGGGGLSVKGGLTVVDTGVTVTAGNVLISSTTPSTAVDTGAIVVKGGGSIALDLYVGDSLSVGTGGLDVADGGGTIASVSTATDTLIVKNTAASGATFPHAILAVDTTALSTGSFSLIDARVVGSSKFTVAASGKTTIAGGGLSVSGGLTVVDTGVTVSAGNVLISSTTPSTAVNTGALVVKGGGSIALDLYVGDSLSVGTGGLDVADGGGTIASVSTATDTLIVKNTAASGATFPHAILAVDTTALSTGSFSLIDARVVGSSKFTVAASGKTTIAGGGLSVSGGLTVVDTGVTVSAGNVLISSTTPSTAVNTGALVVKGGGSIALDLYVGDSLSVGTGGLDVADGGGTIASVSTATDTLIVKNTAASGATFPHAILAVDTTALSTGSFSLIDARVVGSSKFTVAASGKTTIAGGGLDILATGTPVFTVATTGATTIGGGGLSVKGGLTVVDTGVTVTAGNVLISSTTPSTAVDTGAIVVKGGGSIALDLYVGDSLSVGTGGLDVADGGGTIASVSTATDTLIVKNTAASGATFPHAILAVDTTALSTGSFSLIDARVVGSSKFTVAASGKTTIAGGGLDILATGTPVFTVATTGATTIGGGGLSVKGGLTVVDTGVTVTAGNVLISSTTPSTAVDTGAIVVKGGGSIALDLYVGDSLSVGTGGLDVADGGGTIASVSTATDTLIVKNTAASGATFPHAILAVDTTALSTGSFSLIDARVVGSSKFTVAASGKTTIAGGGLSVSGGLTVVDTGVTVSAGNVLISSTTPSTAVNTGALVVKGGGSIALDLYVGDSLSVGTGGLDVADGGGTIASVSTATDTLIVKNTAASGATFPHAILAVDTTALSTGSFSLIDARVVGSSKFTVAASGKTTIAGGGLDILATGTPVFTVATSGATTIGGGGLSVKGGLTVVDTGVTVTAGNVLISSTTPSTAVDTGALVVKGGGSIALDLYVGDSLSVGTGGLDVADGGGTIASVSTATDTLIVKNTAASGATFPHAILAVDTTALSTGSFSLIDARVVGSSKFTVAASGKTTIAGGGLDILATGTPVFTVATTGATTIGGGGLSVKGGLTVVDTGVTVTAGNVLISSTTPSTAVNTGAIVVKGGGSIALDLYVGDSLSVGTGGLDVADGGGTIASVSTATDTLIVKNTAASGATFPHAILAVDTTALSTGSFSLIDARVVGSSKFTVAASGKTTIAGGGLSVSGGLTVVDTGVTVSAGNVLISSTTPSTAVNTGALVVKGGGSIALDLYVGDSLSVGTGGLDVADGGGTIASVSTATDTLIVKNTAASGATFPHAILAVDTTALSTGSFSLIDARVVGSSKFTVAASGKTTIAGGGLDILATGTPVFTVATSGATTIGGGGLSVKGGLTVVDTGVTVTAGNVLISSTTPSTAVDTGALVVKGGGSIALDLYVGDSLSVGTGGLDVADGGGTIASVSTATDTLIVKNTAASGATFPHAILAVDTTALSTGSFSLIDARVVGSSKFTVAASGKTTIAGGGLDILATGTPVFTVATTGATTIGGGGLSVKGGLTVVDTGVTVTAGNVLISSTTPSTAVDTGALVVKGGGSIALDLYVGDSLSVGAGGQISNSDASSTSSALLVKATDGSFAGNAVVIQTNSNAAHNMLKITTGASNTVLTTISSTGRMTITQGGLFIGTGGATVDSGGLYITAGGETIKAGGLKIEDGGETILLGGLNVADGGGTIASVSTATDTLIVKNTAASGATFLHAILAVDTTALSTGSFSLIDARVVGSSKFTVAASGKTTIAGGGLDILATGTPVFTVATSGATTIGGGGLSVKGGLTVVDTGVTVTAGNVLISSTTPSTAVDTGALVVKGGGSIALDLYVGDSLSVGTGGLDVADGGGTIASVSTATDTLIVKNTAASGATFPHAILAVDTTALSTGSFSLIDARVVGSSKFTVAASGKTTIAGGGLDILATGTPVFTVATTGATTIGGGGLSVKGGLTVVDTGVTVTAGNVLISSTTPSTAVNTGALVVKGGGSIALDLYVGDSLSVGTGGLDVADGGGTIASVSTATDTLIVKNTAASGATFPHAILAVDTTALSTGSFSLIDARVVGSSKFTVAASGKTTIAGGGLDILATGTPVFTVATTGATTIGGGGLSVKGGLTVVDTGVTVTAGNVLISSTTPSTAVNTGALVVKGGGSIALDLYVGDSLSVGTGGLDVADGGGTIASVSTATDTLIVKNTAASGATFPHAILAVDTTALSTGSFSLIDARVVGSSKFTVAASGKTTIAGGGLDILATGTPVFTVATTGATTIGGGGLSVKGGLTVVDTGVTVTAGNVLISSTTPSTAVDTGALVVKGGGSIALDLYVGDSLSVGTGGLDVADGGGTIASVSTATDTLIVKNTAASGATFPHAILAVDTTALSTGSFSLIDARVVGSSKFTVAASGKTTIAGGGLDILATGTPVFTVATTGATTIGGGGLSVKGGLTVVDTGVTVTAGNVLISSTTPSTAVDTGALVVKGGGSIALDLYVGDSLSVGTGGLDVADGGGTIASVSTATDTLIVKNTAASGATFPHAILAVDTTALSTGSFSLIDARVVGSSKFTVAASGKTTIAGGGLDILATGTPVFTVATTGATTIGGGGLSVKGGLTVVDTGVTVTAGNVLISSTTPSTAVDTGALVVKGGGSIALDLYVGDSLSVGTGGLDVADGGGTIASVSTATDTLIVKNTAASGATFPHAILAVDTTALSTGSFSLIDARVVGSSKFTVAASGKTTIAGGGLDILATGTPVFTVATTGATTIGGGGLSVKGGLTVVDTGVTVTAGNVLISSTTPSTAVDTGALVVKGGGSIALDLYVGDSLSVGTGGLDVADGGGTIASVSTATDTLIVKNTAASGATFPHAILAVDTTALSTGSFSLIDARVVGSSKFTVAASGKTTIAGGGLDILATGTPVFTVATTGATTIGGGGLSVKGGLTVVDTGVTVTAGNVLISSTTPSTAVDTGALVVKGGGSIALDLYVGDSLSVGTGGLDVADGGGTIASVSTATDTLIVKNTAASGATFPHAILAVDTTALSTGSFSLIDARVVGSSKFTVAASGKTTIAGGGLDILATGTPVFTVATTGATTIGGGGLSVKGGLTVVDTGVTVTAGDVLISSTTAENGLNTGALVVKGGGSFALSLYVGGSVTNNSDRRLKTAVQPLKSSREFIQQLRPVTYEWRRDEFPSRNFPEGVFPGFLADEVEQILPDLVQEDSDGWKSLNYVGVIPHLVRAVQELQDELETAQTLMARMQQQLDTFSAPL
ncbi:hypothetical protein DVH05_022724 [Phytophthora capsici]|nr:hypothetical protein DVH05_022724 [Phytophthora capsici]